MIRRVPPFSWLSSQEREGDPGSFKLLGALAQLSSVDPSNPVCVAKRRVCVCVCVFCLVVVGSGQETKRKPACRAHQRRNIARKSASSLSPVRFHRVWTDLGSGVVMILPQVHLENRERG